MGASLETARPGSLFHQGKRLANQVMREIESCLPQLFDLGSRRGHLATDLRGSRAGGGEG